MPLSRAVRAAVREKFGGRCAYCGKDLSHRRWQVDHIEPKYRGGGDDAGNLNPACARCNNWKSTYTVEEFRREVAKQVERTIDYTPGLRMALDIGAAKIEALPVVFYFERLEGGQGDE